MIDIRRSWLLSMKRMIFRTMWSQFDPLTNAGYAEPADRVFRFSPALL